MTSSLFSRTYLFSEYHYNYQSMTALPINVIAVNHLSLYVCHLNHQRKKRSFSLYPGYFVIHSIVDVIEYTD